MEDLVVTEATEATLATGVTLEASGEEEAGIGIPGV